MRIAKLFSLLCVGGLKPYTSSESLGFQVLNRWESISRSTNLAGSERDRGWEAMQNCEPDALEPLDMRNARGFGGLSRVLPPLATTRRQTARACWPADVAWEGRGGCGRRTGVCNANLNLPHAPRNVHSFPGRPGPARPDGTGEPYKDALGCWLDPLRANPLRERESQPRTRGRPNRR
jgi:hypothetical protein